MQRLALANAPEANALQTWLRKPQKPSWRAQRGDPASPQHGIGSVTRALEIISEAAETVR
jgi:hypothetical protein